MEDSLLDISQDDLLVKETQQPNGDLPVTLSKHLVNHFGIIIGHNIKTSSETVNPIYSKRFFFQKIYHILIMKLYIVVTEISVQT